MSKIRLRELQGKNLGQKPRRLAEGKLKSLHSIRTTGDLSKTLLAKNSQELDIEDLLEKENEAVEQDIEKVEDTQGEYDVGEVDEDLDYDEAGVADNFDIEYLGKIKKGHYIAEVLLNENKSYYSDHVMFLELPVYEVYDKLTRDVLFERYRLFYEIATFIAGKQAVYFSDPKNVNPANLNQMDLVYYLQKYNISKEHVSRMLNALYFRVKGIGDVTSKYLFERYGHKTGLNQEELSQLAKNFFEINSKSQGKRNKFTRLEEAKMFKEFVKKKIGKEIELSDSSKEHDRYKNIKNILNRARKAFQT